MQTSAIELQVGKNENKEKEKKKKNNPPPPPSLNNDNMFVCFNLFFIFIFRYTKGRSNI